MIDNLIRCNVIEQAEEALGNLLGWSAHSDNDTVMGISGRQISLAKSFKISPVMRDKRTLLRYRIGKLSVVELPQLLRFTD